MMITAFPGPKGEAVEQDSVKKFCSTTEMLGWWLQPENQLLDATLYVHDMARSDWNRPDDAHLIDARAAYFVLAPDLPGAMGVTLASFGEQEAAQKLADSHAGRVLRLADIDLALLQPSAGMSHPQRQAE
jgi:copper chaperone NosL